MLLHIATVVTVWIWLRIVVLDSATFHYTIKVHGSNWMSASSSLNQHLHSKRLERVRFQEVLKCKRASNTFRTSAMHLFFLGLGASLGTKKKQVAAHGKSMSGSGWDQNGWNPWNKSFKMPQQKHWTQITKQRNDGGQGFLSAESGFPFFRRSH